MVTRRGKAYLQAYNFSALKLTCSFNYPARLQRDHTNYNTWKHSVPSTCRVDGGFLFPSGPTVSTSLPGVLLRVSTGLREWEDPNRNRVGKVVQNQALCQVLTGRNGLVFSWEAENLFWLLSFNFFYWSLIALQFCVSFCCTTTWISICIQILPPPPHPVLSLPSIPPLSIIREHWS